MLKTQAALERYGDIRPKDSHNELLLANVHPCDWKNPKPAGRYNLVVLGAGTAGLVTAAGAAGLGARVALVERHLMGGDCLNVGCVPSKALIRSSRVISEVRKARRLGVPASEAEADFSAVMERLRAIRSGISRHDSAGRFRDLGVDVFFGEARFSGRESVEVDGTRLRFKRAVIATGARPVAPPIEGLAEAGYLTNETVFSLTKRPSRLAVIGAGPIGCELAQAFCLLGSEVTLIERDPQLLIREDREAADILLEALKQDGVRVCLSAQASRITMQEGAKLIHLEDNGRPERIAVDEILVGVGRAPNVEVLNLESAGVAYDHKGITVNDRLQTTNRMIYAAGDVCLQHKFTHTADAAARIVIQNALFLGRKKISALTVPWCTYTTPEIAHVGLYKREAEERGIQVDTYCVNLKTVDRAVTDGASDGFVKIHTRKGTDAIVGATIVAEHAGDLISELTLAIVHQVGLGGIASVIHPYPTQAEAIRKAADMYNRTRLTPRIKKLMTRWLAWTR